MTARYIIGDALMELRKLPDASVDLVFTSPPFLALRSYLPADHPDKQHEIGSEATPGEYLDVLLDVVVECRRVLAPHGSLVTELGDTYAGQGVTDVDYKQSDARKASRVTLADGRTIQSAGIGGTVPRKGRGWPLDKSLTGIPQLFMLALTYGRNLLTGREIEPWRVRNIVRWCRPNPPVGALGDKFRPATSELIVACTSRDRYFDLDAVREAYSPNTNARTAKGVTSRPNTDKTADDERRGGNFSTLDVVNNDGGGAPPLDFWVIPTEPYKGSHYATFPRQLVVRPVKAMSPERVCRTCGKPSERITETTQHGERIHAYADDGRTDRQDWNATRAQSVSVETLGWSDCGHDDWRPGCVLDPFAGSGTTLQVATGHGRDAIGIDLDERNADLATERCGMFLEVGCSADREFRRG